MVQADSDSPSDAEAVKLTIGPYIYLFYVDVYGSTKDAIQT